MESVSRKINFYIDEDGREVVKDWLFELKRKKKFSELSKIQTRIDRAGAGNFGDHRFIFGNLLELKISFGPGYRVYLGIDGNKLIILVNGGTKETQQEDIEVAKKNWQCYLKAKTGE